MKKFLCFLATMVIVCTSLLGFGCRAQTKVDSTSDQTLEIYLLYKGYQDKWLDATIEMFKNEDWVKEKYPDLVIDKSMDGTDANPYTFLNSPPTNKYDLIFAVNLGSFDNTGITADLTDTVYNATVPGESVKVRDKISSQALSRLAATDGPDRDDGGDSFYTVSYIKSMFSMFYNAELLAEKYPDAKVPVTTNEFLALCDTVKANPYTVNNSYFSGSVDSAIMASVATGYWETSFQVWWAQYEGVSELERYYSGMTEYQERQPEVVNQIGRLRSLEVLEKIFALDTVDNDGTLKYVHNDAGSLTYKQSQNGFLAGNGLFHYNGDYFAPEMQQDMDSLKASGVDYDIRYMKMPVISSIVETLENKSMTDATLAAVIREIDEDKTYSQSALQGQVSENDFNKIAAARMVSCYNGGGSQVAVVPEVSPAKELAFDFLKFMYTDKAIVNFATSSGGTLFNTNYDFAANADAYAQFTDIQKSKFNVLDGTSNYPTTVLPNAQSYALGKAGLSPLSRFNGKFESYFTISGNSAQKIYDAEYNYWKSGSNWTQLLSGAGLA